MMFILLRTMLRFKSCLKDKPEDVFEKIIGTGACDDCE